MPTDRDRFRCALGAIVPLALAAVALAPALGTGYLVDDVYRSLLPGMMRFTGEDFVDRLLGEIRASIQQGRFFPLVWVEHMAVFCTIRDVASYKRLLVASCMVDLGLLMAMVRLITGDWRLATLSATVTAILFQFRTFFDPILSFHGLLQLVTALVLGSLMTLKLYLNGRGWGWLLASSAMHLACLLLYEVTYPLFLLHAVLIGACRPDWRSRVVLMLPFLLVTSACVAATLVVRTMYPSDSYIHALNLAPASVALALARQTSAALPLSAFLADPAGIFDGLGSPGAIARWLARGDVLPVALLAGIGTAIGLRPRAGIPEEGAEGRGGWTLASLGLFLAVLPGVMIAISSRYQGEIAFGVGYLPVFLQYFGVGILMASGLRSAFGRPGRIRWASLAMAGTMGLVAAVTYRSNSEVAIRLNAPPGTPYFNPVAAGMAGADHYPRLNIESALRSGLMEEVADGATILLENPYPHWHAEPNSTFFYLMHLGRTTLVTRARSSGAEIPAGGAFVVHDVCLGREAGIVTLWRVGPDGDRIGPARLFVRGRPLNLDRDAPGSAIVSVTAPSGSIPGMTSDNQVSILRSGEGWYLCEVGGEFDPDSLRLVSDPRPDAEANSDGNAAGPSAIR
jgi:hypothetical protein